MNTMPHLRLIARHTPSNRREPKYITGYLRSRAAAASQHVTNGVKLRDSLKYQEALEEFQRASSIDGTSFVAVQEVQRTIFLMRKQAEAEAEKSAGIPKQSNELLKLKARQS